MTNHSYEMELCLTAGVMAKALGKPSKQYYEEVTLILKEVPRWFKIFVRYKEPPTERDDYKIMKRHPDLVRNNWICEANRLMDLEKEGKLKDPTTGIILSLMSMDEFILTGRVIDAVLVYITFIYFVK